MPDTNPDAVKMKIVDVAVGQKGDFTTVNRDGKILIHYQLSEGYQVFKVAGDESLCVEINNFLADAYEQGQQQSTTQQKFRVGVFPHQGKTKVRYMAYLRDYNPQWKGCCEHEVEAANGTEAKELAIKAHRDEQYRIISGCAVNGDRKEVIS